MVKEPHFSILLPPREEIQSTKESTVRGNPSLIKKVIRYRNGLKITLIQTLEDSIFSVRINSDHTSFRMIGNLVVNVQNT